MSNARTSPVTVEEMYGDWDYDAAVELLTRSLDPRPGAALLDSVASLGIDSSDTVLDIGGREGQHALVMAERFGCRAVCIDAAPGNIERGLQVVTDHEFGHLVELRLGTIEHIPAGDGEFSCIFSRDMLGHIENLEFALDECARVLAAGGAMVAHQVFGTPLLEPVERALVCDYTATVPERLSVEVFERIVADSAFSIESLDVIGSEWAEARQEAGTAPNYLLQVSRLRRDKTRLIEQLDEVPYRVMYGNALWSIYQLIGKLESRVYLLKKPEE